MTARPMSLLTTCGELRWTAMLSGDKAEMQENERKFLLLEIYRTLSSTSQLIMSEYFNKINEAQTIKGEKKKRLVSKYSCSYQMIMN